jgi:tripartite-type tricarboxylate transporter receptor subunit TctC
METNMTAREGVNRRRALTLLASSALPLALPRLAMAQEALDNVKVLLGVPAGSAIDASARRLAEGLKRGYATSTIVENRTGASGIIGVQGAKNSAPDGRTVLVATSSSMTLYPLTYKTPCSTCLTAARARRWRRWSAARCRP